MLRKLISRSFLLYCFCLVGTSFGLSAADYNYPGRGLLLSFQKLSSSTQAQLNSEFAAIGLEAQNGITLYRVSFLSQVPDKDRRPVLASGLIIVPDLPATTYPWISLQHGTILPRGAAPTLMPFEGRYEASQGFVTLVTDYLGYGDSKALFHPYLISKGYTASGVDFLRAARTFAQLKGLALGPLFLQGYSEGGYATLALQKALETEYAGEFPLQASAPDAGPFDMEDVGLKGLAAKDFDPLLASYIMLAVGEWGDLAVDLSKVISYDLATLKRILMSDQFDPKDIKDLPKMTKKFFYPDFVDDFLSPQPVTPDAKAVRQIFVNQSLDRDAWIPGIPTRFHHCIDDEVVDIAYTRRVYQHFLDLNAGAPVSAVLLESPDPNKPYNHESCPLIFAPAAWFKEIINHSASLAN